MSERKNPYKLFDFYDYDDRHLFFGREREVQRMAGEILSARLVVLFSPSGSGKSSLLNAGVRPALEEEGCNVLIVRPEEGHPGLAVLHALQEDERFNVPKDCANLADALRHATSARDGGTANGKPLVAIIDQFEEFFIHLRDEPAKRREFVAEFAGIVSASALRISFVLSLREDYFGRLTEFREAIPSIFQNNANIELRPFDDAAAQRAIERPVAAVGVRYEEGLAARIRDDLKKLPDSGGGVLPITLQIVCHTLWRRLGANEPVIAARHYPDNGGAADSEAKRIVDRCLLDALHAIPRRHHALMLRVFDRLITADKTKRQRSLKDLALLTQASSRQLESLLSRLKGDREKTQGGIVREFMVHGERYFELAHDRLARQIAEWLVEEKQALAKRTIITRAIGLFATALVGVAGWFAYDAYHTYSVRLEKLPGKHSVSTLVIRRKAVFPRFEVLPRFEVQPGITERRLLPGIAQMQLTGVKDDLLTYHGAPMDLTKIESRMIDTERGVWDLAVRPSQVDLSQFRDEALEKYARFDPSTRAAITDILSGDNTGNAEARFRAASVYLGYTKKPGRLVLEPLLAAFDTDDASNAESASDYIVSLLKSNPAYGARIVMSVEARFNALFASGPLAEKKKEPADSTDKKTETKEQETTSSPHKLISNSQGKVDEAAAAAKAKLDDAERRLSALAKIMGAMAKAQHDPRSIDHLKDLVLSRGPRGQELPFKDPQDVRETATEMLVRAKLPPSFGAIEPFKKLAEDISSQPEASRELVVIALALLDDGDAQVRVNLIKWASDKGDLQEPALRAVALLALRTDTPLHELLPSLAEDDAKTKSREAAELLADELEERSPAIAEFLLDDIVPPPENVDYAPNSSARLLTQFDLSAPRFTSRLVKLLQAKEDPVVSDTLTVLAAQPALEPEVLNALLDRLAHREDKSFQLARDAIEALLTPDRPGRAAVIKALLAPEHGLALLNYAATFDAGKALDDDRLPAELTEPLIDWAKTNVAPKPGATPATAHDAVSTNDLVATAMLLATAGKIGEAAQTAVEEIIRRAEPAAAIAFAGTISSTRAAAALGKNLEATGDAKFAAGLLQFQASQDTVDLCDHDTLKSILQALSAARPHFQRAFESALADAHRAQQAETVRAACQLLQLLGACTPETQQTLTTIASAKSAYPDGVRRAADEVLRATVAAEVRGENNPTPDAQPADETVMAELMKQLDDDDAKTRKKALENLWAQRLSQRVFERLFEASFDTDKSIENLADRTLQQHAGEVIRFWKIPQLLAWLEGPDSIKRNAAILLLGAQKQLATADLERLKALRNDAKGRPWVQHAALLTLKYYVDQLDGDLPPALKLPEDN